MFVCNLPNDIGLCIKGVCSSGHLSSWPLLYLCRQSLLGCCTFGLSFGVAVSCEILLEVKFLASGGYNPAVISASFFV